MDRTNALTRGIQLLDLLAAQKRNMGFEEIRRELGGISPPVLTRILKQMTENGVICCHDRTYGLTSRAHFWASAAPKSSLLDELIHDSLLKLEKNTQCTTLLIQIIGHQIHIKDKVINENSPAMIPTGSWLKKNIRTPGSPYYWSQEQIDNSDTDEAFLEAEQVISRAKYRELYRQTHSQGYYQDFGTIIPGVHRLALPIMTDHTCVALLALGYTSCRTEDPHFVKNALESLRTVQQQLQNHLEKSHEPIST